MPITNSEFQSFCDLHEEGTFMDRCGLWHTMERSWWISKMEGRDLLDDVREAQMLHNEDKRAFAVRKREYEGHGKVQRKIRFLKERAATEVPPCKLKYSLRWTSRLRDLCDVRTSGAKMVQSNESVVKCSYPLVKARSMGGPNCWCWWAAVCKKKRVPELRRLRACRRQKKTKEEVIKVIAPGIRFETTTVCGSQNLQDSVQLQIVLAL